MKSSDTKRKNKDVANLNNVKAKRRNKFEDKNFEELEFKEKMGLFIARSREKKKLTQKELGEILHVERQNISKWERAESSPDISSLIPICETLDINIYELLSGESKPKGYDPNEMTEIIFYGMKFYISKTKKKILKICMFVFIGLILFFSLLFLLFNIYKWNVYNINYSDSEMHFGGNIITNKNESIYNFNNFSYYSEDIGTIKEPMIQQVTISFYDDEEKLDSITFFYDDSISLSSCIDKLYYSFNTKEKGIYNKNKNLFLKLELLSDNSEIIVKDLKFIS